MIDTFDMEFEDSYEEPERLSQYELKERRQKIIESERRRYRRSPPIEHHVMTKVRFGDIPPPSNKRMYRRNTPPKKEEIPKDYLSLREHCALIDEYYNKRIRGYFDLECYRFCKKFFQTGFNMTWLDKIVHDYPLIDFDKVLEKYWDLVDIYAKDSKDVMTVYKFNGWW